MKRKFVLGSKRAVALVLVIGVAAVVAACGSDDPSSSAGGASTSAKSQETPTVRVGVAALWLSASIYVAQKQGFFEKEGLNVKPTVVESTPAMVAAIQSGSMDVGVGSLTAVFQAFAQGIGVKILSPNGGLLEDMGAVAVKADSSIKGPKDIVGKTYCINILKGQAEGQARWWLRNEGVDDSKVKFIGIPFQTQVQSLENGRTDVCDVVEPFYSSGIRDGKIRKIGDDALFFGPYGSPATAYFGGSKWAEENPEAAAKFVRAMTATHKYIAEHPESVQEVLPEFTGVTPEQAKQTAVGAFPTEFDVKLLQTVADRSVDVGLVSKKIDVNELLWSGAPTTSG